IPSTPPPSHPSRQHYRNREPQPALWRLGRKVAGKASDPILLDTPCTGSTLPHIHRSWRMAFDQRAGVVLEVSSDQLSRRSRSRFAPREQTPEESDPCRELENKL